jgi:hypothetical protein
VFFYRIAFYYAQQQLEHGEGYSDGNGADLRGLV